MMIRVTDAKHLGGYRLRVRFSDASEGEIDLDWHAVGVMKDGTMVWFWIGSHSSYERLLARL